MAINCNGARMVSSSYVEMLYNMMHSRCATIQNQVILVKWNTEPSSLGLTLNKRGCGGRGQ